MVKFLTIFGVLCLGLSGALAQTVQITGAVTGDEDGQSLPGVSVVVKGTVQGTVTGPDGNYSLSVPGDATLMFSFVGFVTREVPVAGRQVINIVMETDTRRMEEVIVVGYGTRLKKDVTSSITRVGGSDLANLATPSFDRQLAGRASGVQVIQPSGTIGAAPIFRVRGVNSLSSSTQPLFVVDGVPVTSGAVGMAYAANNALGDINPNDIESITVLKDGAATAIYGSRASNGVILITTKKGREGRASLSYHTYFGWASGVKLPKLLNGRQFTEIVNEMYANRSLAEPAVYDGTETDWNDYVYRTGFQHSHTLSVSGGSGKAGYYVSGSYTSQEGIIIANDFRRFTLKADADVKPAAWIRFGAGINASNQKYHGIVEGYNSLSDVVYSGVRMLPNVAVYNPGDATGYNIDATDRKALGRGANTIPVSNSIANLRWLLDNNINTSENYRAITSAFLEVFPVKGLSFKTMIGADILLQDDFFKWSPESGDGFSYAGLMSRYYTPSVRWNWQNILSYSLSFRNHHHIDLTAVQEYNKYAYRYFGMAGQNFSDRLFMQDFISGTFDMRGMYGGSQANGMASYLFRADYNYDNKYYAGGSVRRDGLSKLPEDTRWGTFYGVSAAWRLSGEPFWDGIREIVNDFRIRGSYATVGNQDISGNYPYMGTFSPLKYGNQSGIYYSNVGNEQLKWETQKTTDAGFDMQMLDNRISVEFAWWKKNNSDIVLNVPVDPALGLPGNSVTRNIGRVNNDGFELTIGADVIRAGGFTWRADLNFSTLRNKVIRLVDGDVNGAFTTIREGESMNTLWGYRYAGVNMENGNPMWHKADGTVAQLNLPGTATALYDPQNPGDASRPTTLNADDKVLLGATIPKWFGGFNHALGYGNFDLTLFFRFAGGNKIMNATSQANLFNLEFANKGTGILGRWQSRENPGDGRTPKLYYDRGNVVNREQETNSRFVEDGSFLKLSSITLGYSLPGRVAGMAGMTGVRVYAAVQNVCTITGYSGFDPELTSTYGSAITDRFGIDYGAKPMQRTFVIGLNVTF